LIVVCVVVVVADGVIEEEPADKFADQYREPEPEGQCHDQDFSEGFAKGKFNLIL
jgi:hypothetical protein